MDREGSAMEGARGPISDNVDEDEDEEDEEDEDEDKADVNGALNPRWDAKGDDVFVTPGGVERIGAGEDEALRATERPRPPPNPPTPPPPPPPPLLGEEEDAEDEARMEEEELIDSDDDEEEDEREEEVDTVVDIMSPEFTPIPGPAPMPGPIRCALLARALLMLLPDTLAACATAAAAISGSHSSRRFL